MSGRKGRAPRTDDERVRQLVEEAERGYELEGAPAGSGPGMLLADLTPEVRAAVIARAEIMNATAADVIDAALRESLHVS